MKNINRIKNFSKLPGSPIALWFIQNKTMSADQYKNLTHNTFISNLPILRFNMKWSNEPTSVCTK